MLINAAWAWCIARDDHFICMFGDCKWTNSCIQFLRLFRPKQDPKIFKYLLTFNFQWFLIEKFVYHFVTKRILTFFFKIFILVDTKQCSWVVLEEGRATCGRKTLTMVIRVKPRGRVRLWCLQDLQDQVKENMGPNYPFALGFYMFCSKMWDPDGRVGCKAFLFFRLCPPTIFKCFPGEVLDFT